MAILIFDFKIIYRSGFNVKNWMGIKRRIIVIGKTITFYPAVQVSKQQAGHVNKQRKKLIDQQWRFLSSMRIFYSSGFNVKNWMGMKRRIIVIGKNYFLPRCPCRLVNNRPDMQTNKGKSWSINNGDFYLRFEQFFYSSGFDVKS